MKLFWAPSGRRSKALTTATMMPGTSVKTIVTARQRQRLPRVRSALREKLSMGPRRSVTHSKGAKPKAAPKIRPGTTNSARPSTSTM